MKTNIIVVVAPSGAGKSTLIEQVLKEVPQLCDAITCTTRKMREGESEGSPYYFVDHDEFIRRRQQGYFVEWAKVHNQYYGTPRHEIDRIVKLGKAAIMDIDIQGAKALKEHFPQAVRIFILPPSMDELRRRIVKRHGSAPDDIELRLANAIKEIDYAGECEYRVVNTNYEKAYQEFKKIIEDLVLN